MRTISLRQFRDTIADLDEPVTVQRRDTAGNYQIIGEWHPLSGGLPAAIYHSDGVEHPTEANVVAIARRFTPVPKPARRK